MKSTRKDIQEELEDLIKAYENDLVPNDVYEATREELEDMLLYHNFPE
jgi:hypothetical protein